MDNLAQRYERRLLLTRRVLIVIVTLLVITATAIFFKVSTEAHQILREAKNVRVCMRLLSIESYGMGTSIFDPNGKNGFAKGVEEQVAELSKEDGEVTLLDWNEEENLPQEFIYKKGNYTAHYVANGDKFKTWRVFISINVLSYDNNGD